MSIISKRFIPISRTEYYLNLDKFNRDGLRVQGFRTRLKIPKFLFYFYMVLYVRPKGRILPLYGYWDNPEFEIVGHFMGVIHEYTINWHKYNNRFFGYLYGDPFDPNERTSILFYHESYSSVGEYDLIPCEYV